MTLQKQYSDINLSLKRLNAMDLGELFNGNNQPSRKRTIADTADNVPATAETRISESDTEYFPPESEDSSSSDDDGDVQMNGSRAPQRSPRKQPTHPSRVDHLPLAQTESPHACTTAAAADEQLGVPSTSTSNPVAPPLPPRTSGPHVEGQPAMMQSSTQLMGKNNEPHRDEGALSTSPSAKEAPLDHIAKLFRSACKSMEERAQRRADLQVEQLKKELRSEKEQVLHLKNRLELKNAEANHLTELVGKKEAERDRLKEFFEQKEAETKIQLESLTAELQDQKARMDQMSRHVPCPVCTEKVQQLDQFLAIWRGQQLRATPPPEANVPGSG